MTSTRRLKQREYARRRYATEEGRMLHRERVLRCRYAIGLNDLRELFALQGGRCAICESPGEMPYSKDQRGPGGQGALRIDHDHKTGCVRGLLCLTCNSALGKFGDSVTTLAKAISYLNEKKVGIHSGH